MEFSINGLKVRECDLLPQNHLVEADDKVCIEETSVEDAKAKTAPDKLEVIQMFRINARRRVDLERVIVMRRIFEQAIEWVEHLVREEEEELSDKGQSALNQACSSTDLERPP